MSPCNEGDVVRLVGGWGEDQYLVYRVSSEEEGKWKLELIPINEDDPLCKTRRIFVNDADISNYALELIVEKKRGEYDGDSDQEGSEGESSAVNCIGYRKNDSRPFSIERCGVFGGQACSQIC